MRKLFLIGFLCHALSALALDANHFTITRISAPYFIVDGNAPATLTKAFVGFEIRNNSNSLTTYSGLKFSITSINTTVVGQNYSVVSPSSGMINVGTLAPGQSKVCYFYVSYPAAVAPQGTFNVLLSDATASSKSQSFVIRNRSSISANAGGTATQTISSQDIIGGVITDDVTYVVGNAQNNDEADFQVAVSSQFDPTKVSLLGVQVIASSVPGINVGSTDSIYFITGSASNGSSVTLRWTFKITGSNFTTYLLPCAGATSGSTNYKYALNTSLGSGTPITVSSSANPLTISKTSDKSIYGVGATATFTTTIANPSIYAVTIDKITDELPTGFTFGSLAVTSGVTSSNSTSTPTTGATGGISFDGGVASGANNSYIVPAGGTLILRYTATAPLYSISNLTTTVRDYVGETLVGSATNTVSVSATLPVVLENFSGKLVNAITKLNWNVSSESNASGYAVERNNGNGYAQIGFVSATGLGGSYGFNDSLPAPGKNLYRLKMVDNDGRYQYSNIIVIERTSLNISIAKVWPNPFAEKIVADVMSDKPQNLVVRIIDQHGRIVRSASVSVRKGMNRIQFEDLDKLPAGTYLLQAAGDNGETSVMMIR